MLSIPGFPHELGTRSLLRLQIKLPPVNSLSCILDLDPDFFAAPADDVLNPQPDRDLIYAPYFFHSFVIQIQANHVRHGLSYDGC